MLGCARCPLTARCMPASVCQAPSVPTANVPRAGRCRRPSVRCVAAGECRAGLIRLRWQRSLAPPVASAVAMTAYYAMFEQARLRKGHNILVHSAAGGVGTMLCQMGAIIGCKVVGVVGGAHKVQYALEHGCHHVIDKSSESLWPRAEDLAPDGYHAVFGAWLGVDIKAMRLHRPHAHPDLASTRVCRRERCVHAEAVVQPPGADWAVDSVRLPLHASPQGCVRCVVCARHVT